MICTTTLGSILLYQYRFNAPGVTQPLPSVGTTVFCQATLGIFGDLDLVHSICTKSRSPALHHCCMTHAAVVQCTVQCTVLYSRGCAPVQQGLCTGAPGCRGCAHEVVCTQPLCSHNLCAHNPGPLLLSPCCHPPVTLLLPSCYPPAVLRVVLRGCAPVHQVAEVVHTRLYASCTQPLCSHKLCAHNP